MIELQEKICAIVSENIELSTDQFDVDLSELGMDSLIFIRIVVALEEVFDIEIPDEKLLMNEMNTFNKIISVVSILLENVDEE